MALKVIELFGQATLQDAGRPGYRKFGVPVGGAFDRESLSCANELLGNTVDALAIELALGVLTLEATSPIVISVVGASNDVTVNGKSGGGNRSIALAEGDRLRIGPPQSGLRTVIALPGGVKGPTVLGSRLGPVVRVGDTLVANGEVSAEPRALGRPLQSLKGGPLRVIALDQETGWFDKTYKASQLMDRVGIRLEGDAGFIETGSGRSEPSVIGVVQVTGDGRLVIHGPDGPTIGGYRKVGCVVSADLDRVGQIAPGNTVTFVVA